MPPLPPEQGPGLSSRLLENPTVRGGGRALTWPPALRHLQEPHQTLEAMLRPKVTTLPGHIQAVYVQNVVKLYASILQQKERDADAEAAQELTRLMVERLPQFVQSADLEVQERVRAGRGLLGAQAAPSEDGVCVSWETIYGCAFGRLGSFGPRGRRPCGGRGLGVGALLLTAESWAGAS